MLLTDEEIKRGIREEYDRRYPFVRSSMADLDCYNAVAKAQLKQMVEWGNEECSDHSHFDSKDGGMLLSTTKIRGECYFCWQSLLEEVKDVG